MARIALAVVLGVSSLTGISGTRHAVSAAPPDSVFVPPKGQELVPTTATITTELTPAPAPNTGCGIRVYLDVAKIDGILLYRQWVRDGGEGSEYLVHEGTDRWKLWDAASFDCQFLIDRAAAYSDPGALGIRPIPPIAVGFTVAAGDSPAERHFVSTSTDPDGQTLTGAWQFGDATTGTGLDVKHTYALPGAYGVHLEVTDPDGNSNQTSQLVTIPAPSINVAYTFSRPIDALRIGDEVDVTVAITIGTDGVGNLRSVRSGVAIVSATPTDAVTFLADPIAGPVDLAQGESRSFAVRLVAAKDGPLDLKTTFFAVDASGRAVTGRTSASGLIGSGLRVTAEGPQGGTVHVGEPFAVRYTVTNGLDSKVTALTPAAPTVAGDATLTVLSVSPDSADLDPGASAVFTAQLRADALGAGTINLAFSGTDTDGGGPVSATAATVTIDAVPLEIVVNDSGDAPDLAADDAFCDTSDDVGLQCTLRAAITTANGRSGADRIVFAIPGSTTPRIAPTSALAPLSDTTTIDGTTQAGGWVHLDGSNSSGDGLTLLGGGSTVRGLVLTGHAGAALVLGGSGGHHVEGNRIGVSVDGGSAAANAVGVRIDAGDGDIIGGPGLAASGCTAGCNVISGNTIAGVEVKAGRAHQIVGNLVGTNAAGTSAVPNDAGVIGRTAAIQVGGTTGRPGTFPGNVIAGNTHNNVLLDARASESTVAGNLIGLDLAGTSALGGEVGVRVVDDGVTAPAATFSNIMIGGPDESSRNVIYGDAAAVAVSDLDAQAPATAFLWSNYIGTDITGAIGLGGKTGVVVEHAAVAIGSAAAIGGATSNLIAGNDIDIQLVGGGGIQGNLIGTNAQGTAAIGGTPSGIGIHSSEAPVRVNLISGHTGAGIGSAYTIEGNLIGTDLTGTAAIPNHIGVLLKTYGTLRHNVISGNETWGVETADHNPTMLDGNLIGTDVSGTRALPNGSGGIRDHGLALIGTGATSCKQLDCTFPDAVDATTSACTLPCNVIAGNGGPGLLLDAAPDSDTVGGLVTAVVGNFIGVGLDGAALPNAGIPIDIRNEPNGTLVQRNRIGSGEGPGVLALASQGRVRVVANRTITVPAGQLRFDRTRTAGVPDGPNPTGTAQALATPAVPTSATLQAGDLVVEGQAHYDADDAVDLYIYTAPTCAGPEALVGVVQPDATTGAYSLNAVLPTDARWVLLQASPTDGLKGSSEFSDCLPIVGGGRLRSAAQVGDTHLDADPPPGATVGSLLEIDPLGAHPELAYYLAPGSIIIDRPLAFTHAQGALIRLVTEVHDLAPACSPDSTTTIESVAVSGAADCHDESPSTLTFVVQSPPANGTLTLLPTGSWTYAPAASWSGSDAFTIDVVDGIGQHGHQQVTVTVTPRAPGTAITQAVRRGASRLAVASTDGLLGRVVSIGSGPTAETNFVTGLAPLALARPLRFAHAAGERVVALDADAFVSVDLLAITHRPGPADDAAIAGYVRAVGPSAASAMSCRDGVTIGVSGAVSQTIPAGSLLRLTRDGQTCAYLPLRKRGPVSALVLDLRHHTFGLRIDRADLASITGSATVTLSIGGRSGSETVPLKERGGRAVYIR